MNLRTTFGVRRSAPARSGEAAQSLLVRPHANGITEDEKATARRSTRSLKSNVRDRPWSGSFASCACLLAAPAQLQRTRVPDRAIRQDRSNRWRADPHPSYTAHPPLWSGSIPFARASAAQWRWPRELIGVDRILWAGSGARLHQAHRRQARSRAELDEDAALSTRCNSVPCPVGGSVRRSGSGGQVACPQRGIRHGRTPGDSQKSSSRSIGGGPPDRILFLSRRSLPATKIQTRPPPRSAV